MKNVIVTGANGFIGSSLIRKLIDRNVGVVALDISFTNSKLPESPLIQKIEISLGNADELVSAIPANDYDAFYHLAWAGVNGSEKADPVVQLSNIQMTMHCANAAKKMDCKKFLCAGTIAERSVESLHNLETTGGGMMYGVAKHCAYLMLETYCKNIGLDFVWMQFSNIYGPSNKTGNLVSYTIGELKKGNVASFGPAMQPYDFIYVEDLIEAVRRLGEQKTKHNFYFIGSGESRLLKDYLKEIGRLYGNEALVQIGLRPDDGIRYREEMFDTTLLKAEIGEYTTMSFTEGIQYTLENY